MGIPPLEPKFSKVGGNSQECMDCRILWDRTVVLDRFRDIIVVSVANQLSLQVP